MLPLRNWIWDSWAKYSFFVTHRQLLLYINPCSIKSDTTFLDKYIGWMWRCLAVIQKYLTNISAECGGVSKQYNHWSPFCQNFPTTPFLVAPQELHPALAIKKANFWRKKKHSNFEHNKMPNPKQDCKYLLLCKIFVDEYAIQLLHNVVALYLC